MRELLQVLLGHLIDTGEKEERGREREEKERMEETDPPTLYLSPSLYLDLASPDAPIR